MHTTRFLLLACFASALLIDVESRQPHSVDLTTVSTLTFRKGAQTTGRRSAPVPQLRCVSGVACGEPVDVVQCTNAGTDDMGDVQWKCEADLDSRLKFLFTNVNCEGWSSSDDHLKLAGSCGLEYGLDFVSGSGGRFSQQKQRYGRDHYANEHDERYDDRYDDHHGTDNSDSEYQYDDRSHSQQRSYTEGTDWGGGIIAFGVLAAVVAVTLWAHTVTKAARTASATKAGKVAKKDVPKKKPAAKAPKVAASKDIFTVDEIKAEKTEGVRVGLIKWEGYPESMNTWEPAKNILDPSLIRDFKDRVAPREAAVTGGELRWQYYLDKAMDGKVAGWHDYDPGASDIVENAFQDWQKDPHIDVRSVKSGSFTYMVDFNGMTQTNIDHANHRVRTIRRNVGASERLAE